MQCNHKQIISSSFKNEITIKTRFSQVSIKYLKNLFKNELVNEQIVFEDEKTGLSQVVENSHPVTWLKPGLLSATSTSSIAYITAGDVIVVIYSAVNVVAKWFAEASCCVVDLSKRLSEPCAKPLGGPRRVTDLADNTAYLSLVCLARRPSWVLVQALAEKWTDHPIMS